MKVEREGETDRQTDKSYILMSPKEAKVNKVREEVGIQRLTL